MRTFITALLIILAASSQALSIEVGRIDVEGNVFVAKTKIVSILGVKEGDIFVAEKVSQGIKRLVRTKDFADVQAYYSEEGRKAVLTIVVEEYPRVKAVVIEGARKIKENEIRDKISTREGYFARPAMITRDITAIRDLYAEKGYNGAKIEVVRTPSREEHKIYVTYKIDEGKKVKINHIDVLGNGVFSSKEILGVMESKPDAWYRGGDYKPKVLEEDIGKILTLYRDEGFIDATVAIDHIETVRQDRYVDIYIRIDEGLRYYVGDISFSGNKEIPDNQIKSLIALEEGDPFSMQGMEMTNMQINSVYWENGYIWSRVIPNQTKRRRMIDLDIEIIENQPAYIQEIKISGNTKTFENVIRRELDVFPGDRFILQDVQRSVRDVFQLGYFAGPPKIDTEPVGNEGDINLLLEVEEKQTGSFRAGFGFSQLNRLTGFLGMQENNFLGRGKTIGLDWEFGRYKKNLNIRYTEPYFLDTKWSMSVSLFDWIQDRISQQYYRDTRTGFSIRGGRELPLLDYTRFFLGYRFEKVDLSDFDSSYPENGSLRQVDWPLNKSTVSLSLVRNSTDNPFHPTRGSVITWNTELAGGPFGGNVQFIRNDAEVSWFKLLFWKLTFHLGLEGAGIHGYGGSTVQDYEKFRLGGNRTFSLRGYDFYEVVPEGNDPFVGGTFMTKITQELVFPFSQMVWGLFFYDVGNTWNSMTEANIYNMRRGIGFGIRIEMPGMGNLGFDYGYGYDRIGGPSWEPHFAFGTFF
jgi:outer membrane protein insertion porin family